ncbi:HNH endonuclease [Nocardioides immobilis]|nr:HNH endonuclease [Nocardioides immobilis]
MVAGCGRRSTQVDHIIPLKVRPDLGLVRANLRGICGTCNARKGARMTAPPPIPPPPTTQPRRPWVL